MRRTVFETEFAAIVQSLSSMDQDELRFALNFTFANIGLCSDGYQKVLNNSGNIFDTPYKKVLADYLLMAGTSNKIHLQEMFMPAFARDMKAVLTTPSEDVQSSARFLSLVCGSYLNRCRPPHPFEPIYFDELFAPHMQALAETNPHYVIKSVREVFAEDKTQKFSVKAAIPSFVLALRTTFPSADRFSHEVPALHDYFSNLILAGTYFGARKGGQKAIVSAWKEGMVLLVEHASKKIINYLYEKLDEEAVPLQLGGRNEHYRTKNGYNGIFVRGVAETLSAIGVIMFAEKGPRQDLVKRIRSVPFEC